MNPEELDKYISSLNPTLAKLKDMMKDLPTQLVKEKKNIIIDGREGAVSLLANGHLLIEFNQKGGEEIFKNLPKEIKTNKRKTWL